jgi:hypothetical protein
MLFGNSAILRQFFETPVATFAGSFPIQEQACREKIFSLLLGILLVKKRRAERDRDREKER